MKDEAIKFASSFLKEDVLLNDIKKRAELNESDFLRRMPDLESCAKDPDTNDFDAIIITAVACLRDNQRLPEWLATFVADVLEGKRKRPTKKGPDKYANWPRDYKLWRATQEVAKVFGLPHYSNNELSEKLTAAEIVSQASGCKIDVVVKAYKKFNRGGAK